MADEPRPDRDPDGMERHELVEEVLRVRRELDTMREVAQGNKRHVTYLMEELERSDLPDSRHADPAVAAPGWRPARPDDTPGQLAPELAGDLPVGQQSKGSFLSDSDLLARDARVRTQVAEDLRAVVEKAIKVWALLYPIPANGLARGNEERLADNWARVASNMVLEALAEHAGEAPDSSPAALPDVVGTPDRVWWYHEPCFWSSGPFLASEPRPRRCAGCFSDAGDWLQLVPVRPPISAAEGGGEADLSNAPTRPNVDGE